MLAILPAGGRAERFGGIYKELLPIGEREYLLSSAIERSANLGADRFLVISSADKADAHATFLHEHLFSWDVTLTVRRWRDTELWDSLSRALPYCAERNLLVLPDTTWTCKDTIPAGVDLAFGTFLTDEPHRFSVLGPGGIYTKSTGLRPGRLYEAWGVVYWSKRVAEFWLNAPIPFGRTQAFADYDRAFEAAMRAFGYANFCIENYTDLGTWEAYQRFVRG